MTRRVTIEELGTWCRSAAVANRWLGPLAPWLLRPEHRPAPPRLLDRVGAVHLLLAAHPPDQARDVLAPGFVLPCLWCSDASRSSLLPAKLEALADRVAALAGITGFHLSLDPGLEGMDLTGLEVDVDSCFAPLYAALVLASLGAQPAPEVFATGQELDEIGIGTIQGIRAKLEAVQALGIGHSVVFVPAGNLQTAGNVVKSLGASIELRPYPVSEPTLPRTIAPHLAALDVPPQRLPDNLRARLDWANRPYRLYRPERRVFYLERLVHDLATRLARDPHVLGAPVDSLALAVSLDHSLVVLLVHALQPRRLALLHSPETHGRRHDIEAVLGDVVSKPEHHVVQDHNEDRALASLTRWLGAPGRSVVEITGGTKAASVLLTVAAQRAGAELLYLKHRVNEYGTESFRALDWARDGGEC